MINKEALKTIKVLQAARESSLVELRSFALVKSYTRGEHIFLERDDVGYFFCIFEGIAALYKINSVNEKQSVFIYGTGEMINEALYNHR